MTYPRAARRSLIQSFHIGIGSDYRITLDTVLSRGRAAIPWGYALALLWLNGYLVRHVFSLSFTGATHSMHGYWLALGRAVGDSWWRPQWIPQWAGGMPIELTYSPLVPWLSWHFGLYAVLAAAFVVGPGAFYWMAWQISGRPGWAFLAAVVYSLLSPTEWVQPDTSFGWVHGLEPRRMYVTLVWDEAPHQLALAFVCIAAGAWARGWRGISIGAVVLAALANPFGVTGAALFGVCWGLASGSWRTIVGSGVCGYLIVCPFYPPSMLRVLRANGALAPESDWTQGSWVALAIVTAGLGLIWFFGRRWETETRFIAMLVWVCTAQPVLFYRWDLHFLQQPGRYKSEMEVAFAMAIAYAARRMLAGRPRYVVAVLALAAVGLAVPQLVRHRRFAKNGVKEADASTTIEYRAAQVVRGTVFAPGSLAHWMPVFGNVRQYTGGSYATSPNPAQQKLVLELMGERSAERFIRSMQAVGVDQVLIPGRESPEFWKPMAQDVLAGHVPVVWEERDTRLYEIPRVATDMHWLDAGRGELQGEWRAGDSVLVHMNWDADWKALLNGFPVPTRADEMGQLVVEPNGSGRLELVFEPGWNTRIVSLIGVAIAIAWTIASRRGGP